MPMAWQIFPLLLSLWIISASAEVFESIDCGSSDSWYTDENSISWTGDDDYIQNGESKTVPTTNSISPVMDTLRVFTTRKKNCYSIKAEENGRVLLRVSFHYGNYDRKSLPPSFDLQFDGNEWGTVQTSLDRVVYYEVIYVVKGEYLSVCVAQTIPDQFPFISAIEVRSLDATMYNKVDDDHALFLRRRTAYGTNQTVRYNEDSYDRIWNPINLGNRVPLSNNEWFNIENDRADKPPRAVLQNAVTVANKSQVILLEVFTPSVFPVYINLYFSEVIELDSTQKRSFTLFMGNETYYGPISPQYENFTQFYATNVNFLSNNTAFYMAATPDSTLPPLINAMEVFSTSNKLTSGTNTNDLDGLAALQIEYPLLQEWSGDPCLPATYTWDWIDCSIDDIPRVTALRLSSFGLEGLLANFSSMDSLESIDLRNNSFTGPIPDFLGMFPSLTELNLANNNFSGPIPASLSKKNGLNLVVTGNPDLCTSGRSCNTETTSMTGSPAVGTKKKGSKLPVILGVTIPLFLVIWIIVCVLAILRHRSKTVGAGVIIPNTNIGKVGSSSPSPFLGNQEMTDAYGEVVTDNYQSAVDMNGQNPPELADHDTVQRQ